MLINTKIDYKNKLNSAQYEAATTINGPLLIIAGAGTGKTYMLINRVAYMIEQGIPPESILLLTFTNAAADEMKKRANNILDDRCSRIHASTYHSFCAEMLRKYAKYIGFSNNFTIITPQDVKDAIKYVKAKNPIYKARQFPNCAKIAKIFSGAINNNISITQYVDKEHIECRNFTNELEQLYLEFQTYKKSRDMMDYDDILIYFYELLQNSIIQNRISNSYKYVMVDEYQDTNDLQEKIIIKLCQNNNNIAVVGDDYQSIYGFRGSNVNNFIGFPDKFSNCKRVTLSQNYRSSQEILDFANKIMDKHANFGYKKNMIAHRGYLNEPMRDLFCHFFYNFAVQIYSRPEAKRKVYMLNNTFRNPLPEKQILSITGTIDRLKFGHYFYSDESVIRVLKLDSKEISIIYNKDKSQREITSDKIRLKKKKRERLILETFGQTGNVTVTARLCKCCKNTVRNIIKRRGKTLEQIKKAYRFNQARLVFSSFIRTQDVYRAAKSGKCSPDFAADIIRRYQTLSHFIDKSLDDGTLVLDEYIFEQKSKHHNKFYKQEYMQIERVICDTFGLEPEEVNIVIAPYLKIER